MSNGAKLSIVWLVLLLMFSAAAWDSAYKFGHTAGFREGRTEGRAQMKSWQDQYYAKALQPLMDEYTKQIDRMPDERNDVIIQDLRVSVPNDSTRRVFLSIGPNPKSPLCCKAAVPPAPQAKRPAKHHAFVNSHEFDAPKNELLMEPQNWKPSIIRGSAVTCTADTLTSHCSDGSGSADKPEPQ